MMTALPPGSTIGILGGGQLGRMLALAAARLGLKCHIYAPEADSPAFDVAAARTIADYEDEAALEAFARCISVATYEFENIPVATVEFLSQRVPVRPGANVLAMRAGPHQREEAGGIARRDDGADSPLSTVSRT